MIIRIFCLVRAGVSNWHAWKLVNGEWRPLDFGGSDGSEKSLRKCISKFYPDASVVVLPVPSAQQQVRIPEGYDIG